MKEPNAPTLYKVGIEIVPVERGQAAAGGRRCEMKPTGRRAWRRAAKKLRRMMARWWRNPDKWIRGTLGKNWIEAEGLTNLEAYKAHKVHKTASRIRRHGCTEQSFPHERRYWAGGYEECVKFGVRNFTARSLVGMTMGARKRRARKVAPTAV